MQQRRTPLPIKLSILEGHTAKWREVAQRVANLLSFVALNMQALRKIVKKQDKLVRARTLSLRD